MDEVHCQVDPPEPPIPDVFFPVLTNDPSSGRAVNKALEVQDEVAGEELPILRKITVEVGGPILVA